MITVFNYVKGLCKEEGNKLLSTSMGGEHKKQRLEMRQGRAKFSTRKTSPLQGSLGTGGGGLGRLGDLRCWRG